MELRDITDEQDLCDFLAEIDLEEVARIPAPELWNKFTLLVCKAREIMDDSPDVISEASKLKSPHDPLCRVHAMVTWGEDDCTCGYFSQLMKDDDAEELIAEGDKAELPVGAIINGLEFARRLEEHYDFECRGGSLVACNDWLQLRRCFNALAEHVNNQRKSDNED